jgi:hypothetical protein
LAASHLPLWQHRSRRRVLALVMTKSSQPLVVRVAVPLLARFPIPLSIRTCRFPAYGLPTVFLTWLRCLWVTDSAHQLVQALVVEPVAGPKKRTCWPRCRCGSSCPIP